mgnify:FL=1
MYGRQAGGEIKEAGGVTPGGRETWNAMRVTPDKKTGTS